MTNTTNNTTLISMMVLNKYHENSVSTVLRPHVSSDSLRQTISDLWDYCMLRRESYRAQCKFYLKHDNYKKYIEVDKNWLRYFNITEALQYYYFMTSSVGTDETYSLSYKIITNKLTK